MVARYTTPAPPRTDMHLQWGLVLVVVGSASAPLCTDTRFLVDILDAQQPLYGYRHLLVLHANGPPRDVLCREDLIRMHGNYTILIQTGGPGSKIVRWIQMKVDLIVVMLGTAGTDIYDTTAIASSTLGAFKHLTPILVVHTAELEPGGDPDGRADVDTIVAALRVTGWMHTIIAVQRHNGSRLQKVPVYLSQPGFVPGARCGFGPSTTTLALTWSEGAALSEDAVRFLEPRRKIAFNGCDVHVAPLLGSPFVFLGPEGEVRGLDIELVNYFAADSNVTVTFLPVKTAADVNKKVNRWDLLRHTAEQKKDIGSIYQDFDRADVVVGGLFPTIERVSSFDLTGPYCQDTIYAYVTARMPMAAWRYPFGVLTKRVWAAVFGTMLLLVLVLRVAGGGSGLENTIILYSILSDGDPKPKMTSRTKQFVGLVFLWTVFCMHFNSGYRASLAMASINPMGTPGPKSILDVKRIGFLIEVVTFLLKEERPGVRVKHIQIEFCQTYQNCSEEIRRDPENMGLVMSEMSMWSATPQYFLDSSLRKLLVKRETLATYFVSFLVNKDSVVRDQIDLALGKTREFGFIIKTLDALNRELTNIMAHKTREQPRHDDDFILIIGVLGLLLAGLTLATVVFFGELVHQWLGKTCARDRAMRYPDVLGF